MLHNLKPHPGLCASIQYRLGTRALARPGVLPSEACVLFPCAAGNVCFCRMNEEGYAEPAGGPMVTAQSGPHRSDLDYHPRYAALPDDELVGSRLLFA